MVMRFKDWILNEDGYVYCNPPIYVKLDAEPKLITAIDLQLQVMPARLRPNGNISLRTDDGWINATQRAAMGMRFYDFEAFTHEPMYIPLKNWKNYSLIIGTGNTRIDRNVDQNVAG